MTWLGDILSDAFIKLWRKLWHTWDEDGDGGAFGKFTGAMLPEYAPFEQIEHALRGASVRFNDATWQLIGGFGSKIGDETMGKIDEGVNKAIDEAKAKLDRLISDTRSKLQSQIDELDKITDRFRNQLVDLESAKNRLLGSVDDLDARLRDVEAKMQAKGFAVPKVEDLFKVG